MSGTRLPREFYLRNTAEVARDLLGRTLCRRRPGGEVWRGRLVEVEAYDGPRDRASHAYGRRTARNSIMFERGGLAYVYLIYGVHHCLNVVSGAAGYPAAVLLRAAEPPVPGRSATGPGRLCRTFGVDLDLNGASLLGDQLWLEAGTPFTEGEVARSARIGVERAGWWARRRWRWFVRANPYVSGR